MEAEIIRRYALLAAGQEQAAKAPEIPPLPEVQVAPPTVLDYYDNWLGEQTRKTSNQTFQGLSKSYLDSLANTRDVLEDFATTAAEPLVFPALDQA